MIGAAGRGTSRGTGRRTGRRTGRDAGFTVVEVVVVAVLGSLLIAAAVGVLAGALRSMRLVGVRTATSADVRIAMEQMTRELRVAVKPDGAVAAVVTGTPSSVSFYALLDRTGTTTAANADVLPTLVTYAYDGTCLRATQTPSTDKRGTLDTTRATTKCLLRTTTAPTFAYYDTGLIARAGVDVTPLDASAGLSAADRAATRSVEVRLLGQNAADQDVSASPLTSRVTLTNVVAGG